MRRSPSRWYAHTRARTLVVAAVLPLAGGALASACGPADFDPPTKINSVRILASRADKPYAKPGDTVNLDVLAYDGRPDTSRKMNVYWLPFPCINPRNDLYYACFSQAGGDAGAGDAGDLDASSPTGAGGKGGKGIALGGLLKPGVDLTPFLTQGPTFQVKVPDDIIDSHPPVAGAADPYGLVILFNVACAGHIEIVPVDPNGGPQSVPLGCFDENHNKLGPSEYVIGFTRIYAYASRTNANPVLGDVLQDGTPIKLPDANLRPEPGLATDVNVGFHYAPCKGCSQSKINVVVPALSQEDNPGDVDPNGVAHKEEIWVDYYATDGDLGGEARLVYDTKAGAVTDNDEKYTPPGEPKEGWLFVVLHDNRDGVDWRAIPLHVR